MVSRFSICMQKAVFEITGEMSYAFKKGKKKMESFFF